VCSLLEKITLPNPASFSKHGQIPFFVVFTTQPKSKALRREIAADATIAVSLLRQVTVNIERPCTIVTRPYSAPVTHQKGPPSAWTMGSNLEELDSRPTTTGILKRMVKSAPPRLMKSISYTDIRSASLSNKELPPLPPPSPTGAVAYAETRTLQTRMSIGFPKRPRSACAPDEHPSLEAHAALPDGLYKGNIHLNPQLLPSIDWAGLNVKVSCLDLDSVNDRGQTIRVLIMNLESFSITLMSRCSLAKRKYEQESRSVCSDLPSKGMMISRCTIFLVRFLPTCTLLTFVLLSSPSFYSSTNGPCIILAFTFQGLSMRSICFHFV
jgi:hypothetical protein